MTFRRAAASTAVAFLFAVSGTAFAAPALAQVERPDGRTLPPRVVTAGQVAATLAGGHSFEGRHLVIKGTIDLRAAGTVAGSFRCKRCTITGSVLASDVEFRDVIDLDHTRVDGTVDMRGALFDRGVLWSASAIGRQARFSQAVFRQTTAFDGTVFAGPAYFSWARFQRESSFLGTGFQRAAFFDRVVFIGDATFAESLFAPCPGTGELSGRASFVGATFHGRADFRSRCFGGRAAFSGAIFLGPADFWSAQFLAVGADSADFSAAIFGADASFKLVDFHGGANFQTVSAARDLSFEAATFETKGDLTGATVAGILSFTLELRPHRLSLNNLIVGGVNFDPAKIDVVPGSGAQEKILTETEDTARAQGDLATANDARFERLRMQGDIRFSQATGWWGRRWVWLQDRLFYRDIAGYLVRPLHPVVALGVLAFFAVVMRVLRLWWRRAKGYLAAARQRRRSKKAVGGGSRTAPDAAGQPAPSAGAHAGAGLATAPSAGAQAAGGGQATATQEGADVPGAPGAGTSKSGRGSGGRRLFAACLRSARAAVRLGAAILVPVLEAIRLTAAVAFALRPGKEAKRRPTKETTAATKPGPSEPRVRDYLLAFVRWMEFTSYKILLVLFITCVANVNPTLHQFINTIIGSR